MATNFNPDRYGFVVVGDSIVVMERDHRDMNTAVWCTQEVGIDQCDMGFITRGYMTPDRIQFFTNEYATDTSVPAEIVEAAYDAYTRLYGGDRADALTVPVFNGVKVGKVGETWPPYLVWKPTDKRWMLA